MMVVGGRAHTGSFDKEMSKCVSLCVSVRVCDAVWLTETRELMSWVCVCVFDALFGQSYWPLGWRCGPRAQGIRGLMCGGGWFPLSPHCLIQLQTLRMVGGVKISQSVKPPLSLWVPARFYAWRWRLSARPRVEWAWKHICSLVGCSIVVWRRELVPPPEIKLGPWSLFSCWCWSNLPHVTRKHLNIFIWIKLCITRSLCCSQIIMLICMCLSHSDFCVSACMCLCLFVHLEAHMFSCCLTVSLTFRHLGGDEFSQVIF